MSTQPFIVIVASAALGYRQVVHSSLLGELSRHARVEVWTDVVEAHFPAGREVVVRGVPGTRLPRRRSTNLLRHANDGAWDQTQHSTSRRDLHRLMYDANLTGKRVVARRVGGALGAIGLRSTLESWVGRRLARESMAPEAAQRFGRDRPDLVVLTWPHSWREQAMGREAARIGIPVAASVLSFDNLSTKGRIHAPLVHTLHWSEAMRAEYLSVYRGSRQAGASVVGAAQFDVFFDEALHCSRQEHYSALGLDPDAPVVLYTLGSPQFLSETTGALRTADALLDGQLGPDVQMLVRPHPFKPVDAALRAMGERSPRIAVQESREFDDDAAAPTRLPGRTEDWVNTFRHADVVVNLASTTSIDAAVAGRPAVNIDFDPEPGGHQTELIHRINHHWSHFKPLNESGGLAQARSYEQLFAEIRAALQDPDRGAEAREQMALDVIGFLDGRCGVRYARTLAELTP